ncbi:MAG: hypothetical protein BLM47_02685 [Candidatus Reconcilbacillus cellulovorans]|uniref:Glycosyltransferase RgtA/B/C/D-like domain-containing protein n=1 Tax=Candidatus Reconcilbacillus cellulovorans TaxID=1906605 RepID=A0A2A6E2X3_9BACL|nr:MAG: hypothetical protein BLM47_02685 [Candidatus Reconcilbacillus cellulovorans]
MVKEVVRFSRVLRSETGPLDGLLAVCGAMGLAFVWWWRWAHVPVWPRSWDAVDFALALDRFDMLAMQPHFPGYPYFIAAGMLVHRWVENPVVALSRLNALTTMAAAVPMYLLARTWCGPGASLFVVLLVQSAPYLWGTAGEPMSEGMAAAVFWWYAWAVKRAWVSRRFSDEAVASFAFSVLTGVRLSWWPFGLMLAALWWRRIAAVQGDVRRLVRVAALACGGMALAAAFQGVWIAALAAAEGGWRELWLLARSFTAGHFTEWGQTAVGSDVPAVERIVRVAAYGVGWTALGAQSPALASLLSVWFAFAAAIGILARRAMRAESPGMSGNRSADRAAGRFAAIAAAAVACYAVWVVIGQNVDKPRHVIPVALAMLFACACVALGHVRRLRRADLRTAAAVLALAVAGVQLVVGAQAVRRQAEEMPAVVQMAEAVARLPGPVKLYTWEETRVLEFLQVPFFHERVYTYRPALLREEAKTRRVLLTDHVLEGWTRQDPDAAEHVRELFRFRSSGLWDPVYGSVVVYEWVERAALHETGRAGAN